MILNQFNNEFRDLLSSLISDGYHQKDISSLTFGVNRQDQLRHFLMGRNISGKPLQRILEDLGFELHIVPVSKKSVDELGIISEISENSMEALRIVFVNALDRIDSSRRRKSSMVQFVDNIINKINEGK